MTEETFDERLAREDKEFRKQAATRTIVQQDDDQADIDYTLMVGGDRVELHISYDPTGEVIYEDDWMEWQHQKIVMSKDTLKKLIQAGHWCIEKAEAFEASQAKKGASSI